jgi:hypothetical protein
MALLLGGEGQFETAIISGMKIATSVSASQNPKMAVIATV